MEKSVLCLCLGRFTPPPLCGPTTKKKNFMCGSSLTITNKYIWFFRLVIYWRSEIFWPALSGYNSHPTRDTMQGDMEVIHHRNKCFQWGKRVKSIMYSVGKILIFSMVGGGGCQSTYPPPILSVLCQKVGYAYTLASFYELGYLTFWHFFKKYIEDYT